MSASSSPSGNSAVVDRINKLTQQISAQESAIQRSSSTVAIVAVIALVLVGGYFWYGYEMIASLIEPKTLVPYAAGMLQQNLPAARQSIVQQINDSAPAWAQQLSVKARETVPELRNKLEEYVLNETEKMLGHATGITEEKFRKVMHENHDVLERGFKELADHEKLSDECLNVLVSSMEQELQTDLKDQAEMMLETLRHLSTRVQRVASGKNLNDEERCERRIAMLARRLQMMEADPNPIKMPEFKPAKAESAKPDSAKADCAVPQSTLVAAAKPETPVQDGGEPATSAVATTAEVVADATAPEKSQ